MAVARGVAAIVGVVVIAFAAILGGFLLFGAAFGAKLPAEDEMPSASELPLPDGLALENGYCSGGSAGCYKGVQVFEVHDLEDPGIAPPSSAKKSANTCRASAGLLLIHPRTNCWG